MHPKLAVNKLKFRLANTKINKGSNCRKGQEAVVDFSEFLPSRYKARSSIFKVSPDDAIMSIDGEEVDYSEPIQLTYGKA